jgi:hypothetical protein
MSICRLWIVFFFVLQLGSLPCVSAQELQVNWAPTFEPARPGEVEVEGPVPLGDGRYRIKFSAAQPTQYELAVDYQVVGNFDGSEPVEAVLTFPASPNLPASLTADGFLGTLGPILVDTGLNVELALSVSQPNIGPQTTFTSDRQYTVPSGPSPIEFFADVFDDGHYELSGGGYEFVFDAMPGTGFEMVGHATAGGLKRHFQTTFDIVNRPPTLEHVAVNLPTNGSRQLILLANAIDLDHDTLRFRVRWGDGEEDFFTDRLLVHQYETDGPFDIEVTVFDYRDEFDQVVIPFSFPAFTNVAPVVTGVDEVGRLGFERTFLIDAYDPERETLGYRVDWGDGTDPETTSAPLLIHTFPSQRPAQYAVSVWAIDGLGQETRFPFDVNFAADLENQPPVVSGVYVIERDGGEVTVAVEASDPDGQPVSLSIDWGDGTSTLDQAGRIFEHEYAVTVDRSYGVVVTATDSVGAVGVGNSVVIFDPFENDAPIQLSGTEIARDGFVWVGQFHADDPDGDELVYTVDFRDGSAPVVSATGLVRHTFPDGQYQTYSALVTASDGFGGQVSLTYDVDFPVPDANQPPVISAVTEVLRDGRSVVVKVDAVDPDGDAVMVDFEWGDGFVVLNQSTYIAAHSYGDEQDEFQLRVRARDSLGAVSEVVVSMVFEPPLVNQAPVFVDKREISRNEAEILFLAQAVDPEGAALRYRWRFDEGSADIQTETPLLAHQFPHDVSGDYVVEVRATDDRGAFVDTTFDVNITPPPPNLVPVIVSTYVVHTSQYEVMVFIDAYDPENDELAYIFDWGDGSLPFETTAPFAAYTYPENVFRDYPLSVIATDGLQQSSEFSDIVSIAQPPNNSPPEVEDVEIIVSPRGVVELRVTATDAENDRFEIIVDWGDGVDEDETPVLRAGLGTHRYAYRPDRAPYEGLLTLTDEQGGITSTDFSVTIPDSTTEINQTDVTHLGSGLIHVSVMASDLDSPGQLLHSFDFDGDFVFERPSRLSGDAFYQYAQPGLYQVNVLLTDPWSGQTVTQGITVDVPDWLAIPVMPTFDRVVWTADAAGHVQLSVEIDDPDELVEDVEVSWGDEAESGSVDRIINGMIHHRYGFQTEPYEGRVTARTRTGSEVTHAFEVRLTDRLTSFGHLTASALGQGRVFISGSAFDEDSPQGLTYVLDVHNDGNSDTSGFGSIGEILTFEAPGAYSCRVAVQDGWSGRWTEEVVQFTVEPWIGRTQPPVIGAIQVEQLPGGVVRLSYDVDDVSAAAISVSVHWGDEETSDAVENTGPLQATHRYDPPRFERVYYGFVDALSESGLSTRLGFTIDLVDEPTEVLEISATLIDDRSWRLNVVASDPDSDGLLYSFDVNDDGELEVNGALESSVFFSDSPEGSIPVRVFVQDPWSGVVFEELFTVVRVEDDKNLAPEIVELSAQIMPGGQVHLLVDARDPNGDRMVAEVTWGDETSESISGQRLPVVGHRYGSPSAGYLVTVTVSDEEGLSSEANLTLQIVDMVPQAPSLEVVHLGDGWVMFSAFAYDPDGVSLYAFDVDGDGAYERMSSPVASWTFRYPASGDYLVGVRITDPWSGEALDLSESLSIAPWNEPVPIIDDHIVLLEGSCLSLQVASASQIVANTQSGPCEPLFEDGPWTWDMGDGNTISGRSVRHLYGDQGTYLVTVSRDMANGEIQSSVLSVLVQNGAPSFASSAFPLATAGEVYNSSIRVTDPGTSDIVHVNLLSAPSDMTISPEGPGLWALSWSVPLTQAGSHEIILEAIDGHDSEDGFVEDGGRTEFQFTLFVEDVPAPVVDIVPEPVQPGSLSGGASGCNVSTQGNRKQRIVLTALCVLLFGNRRRRQ